MLPKRKIAKNNYKINNDKIESINIEKIKRSKIRKKLLVLIFLALTGFFLFLIIGLNGRNIAFNLPRRWNKILAILIVSYTVGYSSVVFQTITNNKILTPSVMGLDSLYMFIQTVVVFFFGTKQIAMMSDLLQFFISTGIMIISSLILYMILFRRENQNIYFLVLVGMILGGLFSGLSNFMQILLDPNEFLILQGKMFATFSAINTSLLSICSIIVIACIVVTIPDLKKLDVLSLGEFHAINLGINYSQTAKKMFIIISILVSISTVLVGPVMFLGILLASLSREILNDYRHSILVLGAFLIVCVALIYSLLVVEQLLNFGTTVNTIINFVGGIYFIYIMLKERNK